MLLNFMGHFMGTKEKFLTAADYRLRLLDNVVFFSPGVVFFKAVNRVHGLVSSLVSLPQLACQLNPFLEPCSSSERL